MRSLSTVGSGGTISAQAGAKRTACAPRVMTLAVRGVEPAPKLGEWVEVLTEILEQEAKLPRRERLSNQRLFEELRGRGYDGAHDSSALGYQTPAAYADKLIAPRCDS